MQNIKSYTLAWYARGRALVYQYDIVVAVLCAVSVVALGVILGLRNDGMIAYRLGPNVHYSLAKPLSVLAHWDGLAYLKIARFGYKTMLDAGFFPLYPLMIRVLHAIINSYLLSALFISWIALIGAIYFYIKIIRHLGLVNRKTNLALAVAPFVLFPTAVFMIVTYTEGLFALFALASIYYALQKRYGLVGLFILLATLTHVTGAFLIVLDGLILSEENLPIKKILAAVAVGSSGLLMFMGYLYMRFHNPLEFLKSQTHIHGWLKANYLTLFHTTSYLNLLFVILLVAAAVYYWNRRRSFSVYCLLFLLIPLVGAQWGGFNRYVMMAFPVPIMLYEVFKGRQIYILAILLTAIFWTYTLLQYAAGYISS